MCAEKKTLAGGGGEGWGRALPSVQERLLEQRPGGGAGGGPAEVWGRPQGGRRVTQQAADPGWVGTAKQG